MSTGPLARADGARAMTHDPLVWRKNAGCEPNLTAVTREKFLPQMKTTVNAGPEFGDTWLTIGTVVVVGALTVSVAAFVVVDPNALVNTASYSVPDSLVVVAPVDSVAAVAPVIGVNELAPGASDSHCTVGAAQLAAVEPAAVNDPAAGAVTVTLVGCVTTAGAAPQTGAMTVSVAAFVVVDPNALVNTASYSVPDSLLAVAPVDSVADVAPLIGVNELAPGASDCHCTVGAAQLAGVEPAAVNEPAAGAVTVTLVGCVTIPGAAPQAGVPTVSVAAFVVVEPNALVSTARY